MGSLMKKRFPKQGKAKLDPQRDRPFQVLDYVNVNTYKINMTGEYEVSASFNVSNLSPVDVGEDSRMNHSEEGVMMQKPSQRTLR